MIRIPFIVLTITLAGCDKTINDAVEAQLVQSTGHGTPALALITPSSEIVAPSEVSIETATALIESSEPVIVASSSSSSIEGVASSPSVAPETCAEGDRLFRVWDCVNGVKVYW